MPALLGELHGKEFKVLTALNALEALGDVARPAAPSIAAAVAKLPKPRGENYCARSPNRC